jgi:hypothetical protein
MVKIILGHEIIFVLKSRNYFISIFVTTLVKKINNWLDNFGITNYGITMKIRKAVKTYRIDQKLHRHFVATVRAENKRGRAITVSAATAEAIAMWVESVKHREVSK